MHYVPEAGAIIFILLAAIIVSKWKIFVKAGRSGVNSLIPFFNIYSESDILFGSPIYFAVILVCQILSVAANNRDLPALLILVLIVRAGSHIWGSIRMARVFGKGSGFAVGLILLPFIFLPAIAFGDSEYIDNTSQKIIEEGE